MYGKWITLNWLFVEPLLKEFFCLCVYRYATWPQEHTHRGELDDRSDRNRRRRTRVLSLRHSETSDDDAVWPQRRYNSYSVMVASGLLPRLLSLSFDMNLYVCLSICRSIDHVLQKYSSTWMFPFHSRHHVHGHHRLLEEDRAGRRCQRFLQGRLVQCTPWDGRSLCAGFVRRAQKGHLKSRWYMFYSLV